MCRNFRLPRAFAWGAVALALALSGAPTSKAGTLTVDFSLAGSTLQLGTLLSVANGNGAGMPAGNPGTQVMGMARVILTGVDSAGMITGGMAGATVSGLNLTFNVNQPVAVNGTVLAGANLVGPISITQMGMAMGAFDGMNVTLAPDTFTTQLAVSLDCQGALCDLVKQVAAGMMPPIIFPITQMATISNAGVPFAIGVNGLGSMAMLNAVVNQMNMGQNVTLTFNGQEVARNFVGNAPPPPPVPEPVESGLLILGVLALCGVAAVRRQQAA